ncbi:hypothetical protein RvY_01137 [Ramazzottius varieornatus]|uniref:CCD97-like C-terminal domain-containing protein n=1 Tax=Ramazzottius varieornatus TaxID=947166 RepID=A0A1D1UME7_RAMVA|nr:hypothetical protein RvY_01137 [Ramazzottius varieornatus]
MEPCTKEMLNRVASLSSDDVRFRNQARDEPELTYVEKMDIVSKVLHTPSNFLFRFGPYLNSADLEHFEQFSGDPDVAHQLQDLRKQLNSDRMRTLIRNRRFASIDSLTTAGYFDESEMQRRDPLLYEELVEKHMTPEEKLEVQRLRDIRERAEKRDSEQRHPFADILMESLIEKPEVDAYRERQREKEQGQTQEEEKDTSDEEGDAEDESTEIRKKVDSLHLESTDRAEPPEVPLDDEERALLREEFRQIMQERFLEGKDSDFLDYGAIDQNAALDRSDEFLRDEEDRYFDDEEPS